MPIECKSNLPTECNDWPFERKGRFLIELHGYFPTERKGRLCTGRGRLLIKRKGRLHT